jgi:PilZ domain
MKSLLKNYNQSIETINMPLSTHTTGNHERRRYSRVLFDADVELRQNDARWRSKLLDISLKGLLLRETPPQDFIVTLPIDAIVFLGNETTIAMSVMVAHQEKHQTGLKCTSIDIDSICHLRRLIEFNLGDSSVLERELTELSSNE